VFVEEKDAGTDAGCGDLGRHPAGSSGVAGTVTIGTTEFTIRFVDKVRPHLPTLDYDFIEWHREEVALLTNLSTRELPDKSVTAAKLPNLSLLVPTAGLRAEFLRRWYGPEYPSRLPIVAEIDALYYGLGLLDSQLLHGCLLTTSQVARAATEGRLPGGHGLRIVQLADDFDPALELVTGVFGRKNERDHYASDHPLNLLWNEFIARCPAS
jgi:hypothetical protein